MEFLGLVGEEVAEAPNVRIGSRKPTGIAFRLIDSSSERLSEFCSCTGGAQGPGDKIKILQPQKSGNCSCRLQMEEDSGILGSHHRPAAHRSRLRLPSCAGGDAAAVQGPARSTARKDRHSKVSTAKGPRDRRLRLSALTAIQFYDVQDRLGFDRPSKAVDWLILNAKHAIDQLATSPAPPPATPLPSSFLPPSLDSDAVAYTIKSFFPTFDDPQMLTRSNLSQDQDLRLSLQSFQDPGLGFNTDMAGWAEQSQRMAEWNAVETGFPFNVPPPHAVLLFSQREPLQSMNSPLARGWVPAGSVPPQAELQMCPMFELEAGSTGFHIPAQFGGEEERGEVSDKPPSASASRR